MVRSIKPEQLERLLEARHRSRIWLIIVLVPLIAVAVLLVSKAAAAPVGLCVLLGLTVGRLVNAPYLRVLKELGLTRTEGLQILAAEQDRRSGRAALPPDVRAHREQRLAYAQTVGGLVAAAVLVVAACYFLRGVNKPVDENAPADVWMPISFIAGFITVAVAPALLWTARQHHVNAAVWRGRAGVTK